MLFSFGSKKEKKKTVSLLAVPNPGTSQKQSGKERRRDGVSIKGNTKLKRATGWAAPPRWKSSSFYPSMYQLLTFGSPAHPCMQGSTPRVELQH